MALNDIEIGREYFCREESTGKHGRFSITTEGIQATFFAFDEELSLPEEGATILRLENNKIISLHESFNLGSGLGSHVNSDPHMSSHSSTIIANVAVAGYSPWLPDDELWQTGFVVPHADALLRHRNKFRAIAEAKIGADVEKELLKISTGGMTVQIWYGASGSIEFSRPQMIEPYISIEFDEFKNLLSYVNSVYCVVQFLSAAICESLQPDNISLRRLPHDQWMAEIAAKRHLGGHSALYIWKRTAIKSDDVWIGRCFAHVHDDAELRAFCACLKAWIERDAIWSNATHLMMSAFKLRNVMSADRLLNAFKWLEETPETGVRRAINEENLEKILGSAIATANELGISDLEKRIRGGLAAIKTENHEQRFSRLIREVRETFGETVVPDELLDALKMAVAFRGKSAHGLFLPKHEEEYQAFQRSVYGLECLCYLLLVKDLPMSLDGRQRVYRSHPVQNFRLSLES